MRIFFASIVAIFTLPLMLLPSPGRCQSPPNVQTARTFADACQKWIAIESGEAERIFPKDDMVQVGAITMQAGYCVGYINGIIGGQNFKKMGGKNAVFCLPEGVTVDQVARLIIKKVDENPEFEHLSTLTFVSAVLTATWPCAVAND